MCRKGRRGEVYTSCSVLPVLLGQGAGNLAAYAVDQTQTGMPNNHEHYALRSAANRQSACNEHA